MRQRGLGPMMQRRGSSDQVEGYDLVIADLRNIECDRSRFVPDLRGHIAHEQVDGGDLFVLWNADPNTGPYGYYLAERSFHHHRIGKVYQVNRHRALLSPDCYVDDSFCLNLHDWLFAQRPADRIAQEQGMVGAQHLPERAVQVAGEISHTAFGSGGILVGLAGEARWGVAGGDVAGRDVRGGDVGGGDVAGGIAALHLAEIKLP